MSTPGYCCGSSHFRRTLHPLRLCIAISRLTSSCIIHYTPKSSPEKTITRFGSLPTSVSTWSHTHFVPICTLLLPSCSQVLTSHQPTVLSDRSQILGDFSESNTGEYTGRVPLLLGGCLPLCGHGPAPVSYISSHLCRVGAKSLHPISLRYSQTDPKD